MPPVTYFCPTCQGAGQTSVVTIVSQVAAATSITEFYDEGGVYHCHNTGTFQTSYSCSKGHSWSTTDTIACPAGDM
jgi:hypothetical protein